MLQKLKTIHHYRPVVVDAFRSQLAKNSSILAKGSNTLLNVVYFVVKRIRSNQPAPLIKNHKFTLTKSEEQVYVKIWGKK